MRYIAPLSFETSCGNIIVYFIRLTNHNLTTRDNWHKLGFFIDGRNQTAFEHFTTTGSELSCCKRQSGQNTSNKQYT